MDTLKLAIAVGLIVAGMAGFYMFPEYSQLLRVIALLAVTGAAIAIAVTTERGRIVWAFLGETRTEVRKVVWPTRKETVQTTLIVMGVVLVVAVFLWVLDMVLGWAVSSLTT